MNSTYEVFIDDKTEMNPIWTHVEISDFDLSRNEFVLKYGRDK